MLGSSLNNYKTMKESRSTSKLGEVGGGKQSMFKTPKRTKGSKLKVDEVGSEKKLSKFKMDDDNTKSTPNLLRTKTMINQASLNTSMNSNLG